jgi:hypothetical protein
VSATRHPTAAAKLKEYLLERKQHIKARVAATFFINDHGRPLHYKMARTAILHAQAFAGIIKEERPGHPGPTLHALRHSFAGLNPDPNQYVTSPFSPSLQLFQPLVPAAGTGCNGTYYGLFSGNITISSGQSCTFLAGGITGNVVENGGSLTLNGATVQGNVQVNGSGAVSIGPATAIGGNLSIQNLAAAGPLAQVCGSTIQGNLVFQNNATAVEIGAASGHHNWWKSGGPEQYCFNDCSW